METILQVCGYSATARLILSFFYPFPRILGGGWDLKITKKSVVFDLLKLFLIDHHYLK